MPRQPGTPKTGGRQPGTPNRITADVKAVAATYTAQALETLAEIMQDGTAPHSARVAAANALLDRAVGKPRQELEHASNEKEAVTVIIREFVKPPDY